MSVKIEMWSNSHDVMKTTFVNHSDEWMRKQAIAKLREQDGDADMFIEKTTLGESWEEKRFVFVKIDGEILEEVDREDSEFWQVDRIPVAA